MKQLFYMLLVYLSVPLCAKTSMDKIIDKYHLTVCANALSSMASDIISSNKHRLLFSSQTPVNEQQLVLIDGVIEYRDRQAHISFSASAVNDKQCLVNYVESYVVKTPCIVTREEVFKKWIYQGQLNAQTMVFKHKRDEKMKGFLTNASDGSYCLVSQQKSNVL